MEVKRLIPIVVVSILGVLLLVTAVASVITVIKVFGISNSVEKEGATTPARTTTTTPTPQPSNDTVHVNDPDIISPTSPKYDAFLKYQEVLEKSMNFSREPCTDFFEYVCEKTNEDTIDDLSRKNLQLILEAMNKQPRLPVEFYLREVRDKCVRDINNPNPDDFNGKKFLPYYKAFRDVVGLDFPIIHPSATYSKPSPSEMAKITAHLINLGSASIVGAGIGTVFYKSDFANTILVAPPTPLDSDIAIYLLRHEWDSVRPYLKNELFALTKRVALVLGFKLDLVSLEQDIEKILNLEKFLADNVFAGPTDPKDFARDYVEVLPSNATGLFKLIDFNVFLSDYIKDASEKVKARVLGSNFKVTVYKGDKLRLLHETLESSFDGRTTYNYLFIRLAKRFEKMVSKVPVDSYQRIDIMPVLMNKIPKMMDEPADAQTLCNNYVTANITLPPLYNRWFIEGAIPIVAERQKKIEFVAKVTENVINGFKAQIQQLAWTNDGKEAALSKIKKIQRNLLYSAHVFNDTYINEAYKDVSTEKGRTYLDELNFLAIQSAHLSKEDLLSTDRERDEFPDKVCEANAAYDALKNSININAGLMREPIFNVNYPLAVIYGGVGSIIGHEIVHGFDTAGVQVDGDGYVNPWLDSESRKQFEEMEKCVINEFNNFNTSAGVPVNGSSTVGENIADSGGIRASFNAFKLHSNNAGEDPRLPSPRFSKFTNDQLFFIALSRTYCTKLRAPPASIYSDPHAPRAERVLGILQNTPAFKSAFNCKSGDRYSPKQHCNVYTSVENGGSE